MPDRDPREEARVVRRFLLRRTAFLAATMGTSALVYGGLFGDRTMFLLGAATIVGWLAFYFLARLSAGS